MRNFILSFLLIFPFTICYSQKNDKDDVVDTTSKTNIERLIRQTSITKKLEFVEVEKVKVLSFQIIVVINLKTGEKVKGLYLSNQGGVNFWTGYVKGEHHAYLDEYEIDDLIQFLENCDSKWKNEEPINQTQYEFETLDNLKISFWTRKNSKSWSYSVKFASYIFDNTEILAKSQSDELLNALKQVKAELQKY